MQKGWSNIQAFTVNYILYFASCWIKINKIYPHDKAERFTLKCDHAPSKKKDFWNLFYFEIPSKSKVLSLLQREYMEFFYKSEAKGQHVL